jgi:RNA polymerase sigma factor (sigma-70 family)
MQPGFEEYFHRRYFDHEFVRLVAYLRRIGATRETAEDAAQQAFAEAYRQWVAINQPEAWLRRVATRIYFARASEPILIDMTDDMTASTTHERMDNLEQSELVMTTLKALPMNQRVVMAWAFDGYTPAEIAHETGLKPEHVRKLLQRARESLRHKLSLHARGRQP